MDIKSKKWKNIVSYTAFVLGISLLISTVASALGGLSYKADLKKVAQEFFEKDYQNTHMFRQEVSEYLETFLAMATGGPINYYNYTDLYEDMHMSDYESVLGFAESSDSATIALTEDSAYEYAAVESDEIRYNNSYIYEDYNSWGYDYSPEENLKAAKMAHEAMKNDKNVLYTVTYDGEVKFSNAEGHKLDGFSVNLPDGYNFLLYFDGNTVRILKDGREIDVYQNGNFTMNSDWYVPGYKNYTVNVETKKASVCIAVAKDPLLYVSKNYIRGDENQQSNYMYWIQENMKQNTAAFLFLIISFIIALLCLLLYFILRREKKNGDYWLAVISGKLWLEVKILLLLLAICFICSSSQNLPEILNEFKWMFYNGEILTSGNMLMSYFLRIIFEPVSAVLIFWIGYLLINDLRYNKKPWKHSVFARVIDAFKTIELKLPFQKRFIHNYLPVFISGLILAALLLIISGVVIIDSGLFFNAWFTVFIILAAVSVLSAFIIQIIYARKNKALAIDLGALIDQITEIHGGNFTSVAVIPQDSDLYKASENLNDIRAGMDDALDEKIKSERMKVELVSNVSHDIKTPLTSIISYVELLKQEESLPEHVKDYVSILDNKSQRLKAMVQDVFEVSKAASGQLSVQSERLDLGKLLRQTLAEMEERIENSAVTVKSTIPEEAVVITSDGQRLYRVFQNLLLNALQYSLDASRVYVTLENNGTMAVASVKNTSRFEIKDDIDFTERFTRGDENRTDGGSGLGLSIAQSFTEACGGIFHVETIADLFVVTVKFDITEYEEEF